MSMPESERDALLEEAMGAAMDRDGTRALALLDQLLAADPDDIDALLVRGYVLEGSGEPQLARPLYERVLELRPGSVLGLIAVSDCDVYDDRLDDALAHLEEAHARIEAGLYEEDRERELKAVLWRKEAILKGGLR